MKLKSLFAAAILTAFLNITASGETDVVRDPINGGAAFEVGQFMKAVSNYNEIDTIEAEPFNRLGVALTQRMVADNKFELSLGVGGLFFNSFPTLENAPWALETKFGPGITEAVGTYHFGDIDKRDMYLEFGFFPIKYNDNALNLGEYLFRSGTYPPLIFTQGPGSWQWVNGAFFDARGARFHWELMDGALTQDFTLFFETRYPPLFDLTPSYIAKFNAGDIFQIGAGISYNHLFPMIPSKLRPKFEGNRYVEISGLPAGLTYDIPVHTDPETGAISPGGNTIEFDGAGGTIKGMWLDVVAAGIVDSAGNEVAKVRNYHSRFDPADVVVANAKPQEIVARNILTGELIDTAGFATMVNEDIYLNKSTNTLVPASQVADPLDPNFELQGPQFKLVSSENKYDVEGAFVYPHDNYYFTFQGIKLMGMMAFDPKPLFGSPEIFAENDLKLFVEMAVLGVQDQVLLYDDITQRMPIMMGFNVPTFKLLDILSVQAEYYKNRWPMSSRTLTFELYPQYRLETRTPYDFEEVHYDDWKWSVLAKRSWGYGNIYLQVASDHIRTNAYASPTTYFPLTMRPSDWYYVLKFEYGL